MKVFFKSNLGLRHYDAGHKRHLVKISQGLYHRVDNKLDFNAWKGFDGSEDQYKYSEWNCGQLFYGATDQCGGKIFLLTCVMYPICLISSICIHFNP